MPCFSLFMHSPKTAVSDEAQPSSQAVLATNKVTIVEYYIRETDIIAKWQVKSGPNLPHESY